MCPRSNLTSPQNANVKRQTYKMGSSTSTTSRTLGLNMAGAQHEEDINTCRVFKGRLSISVTVDLTHFISVEVDAGFEFRGR